MDSYDAKTCSTVTPEGRICGKPAGAGVGGFNGWCRAHFEAICRRLAAKAAAKAGDALYKWGVIELIHYAVKHLPDLIVNYSRHGAGRVPPEVAAITALKHRGRMLEIGLHGPLGIERILLETEEWWESLPPAARDAARAWAERRDA